MLTYDLCKFKCNIVYLLDTLASSTRAYVYTSAYARSNDRIGLTFKSVELKQMSLFGIDTTNFISLIKVDLPKLSLFGINQNDNVNSPGYFDILYLDKDLLIIKQNEPGIQICEVLVLLV